MKARNLFAIICASIGLALFATSCVTQSLVQYEQLSVAEESGQVFLKLTDESTETLTSPNVHRTGYGRLQWWGNPLIAISPDGNMIAYNVAKNGNRNIFTRSLNTKSASTQRTFRSRVNDVAYSPDGNSLCFSEIDGSNSYIYIASAVQNTPIRRISPQNVEDYAPSFSKDGSKVFFTRKDGNGYSIWSYDLKTTALNNYCMGSHPVPIDNESLLCTRTSTKGFSEVWIVNYKKGTESLVLSNENQSYSTPSLSPDGKWIVLTANTIPNGKMQDENLDIYVVRLNGSQLTQLTYHRGHDVSPVWSKDGKHIIFLSQRGTKNGEYNIFQMEFNL